METAASEDPTWASVMDADRNHETSNRQQPDDRDSIIPEITHLYLTFKTPLPPPNIATTLPNGSRTDGDLPPCPDLEPYTNPIAWSSSRKYLMLSLSCFATFLTAYTSGSYSPPHELMREDLGAKSNVAVLAGITTFCVGFGLAPMVLAPFSEMNGRYPVFIVSGIVYVVFQAVCGVVRNLAGMLVARLFVGIGASVFSTMVGGVIADMWDKEGRNTPMALFSGCVLMGTGAGPLFAALMTRRLGHVGTGNAAAWKWVFWHQVILGAVCMVALVILFKESRGSVLLSRKAKALNRWYEQLEERGCYGVWIADSPDPDSPDQTTAEISCDEEKGIAPARSHGTLQRIRWLVKEDEERSSLAKMISVSVTRPFHLLFTESVVFFFSLWVSFAWGVLYLAFGSIPLVFRRQYGWDIERAGLAFNALIVGTVIGTGISIWQERILHSSRWGGAQQPSSATPTTATSSSFTLDTSSNNKTAGDTPSDSTDTVSSPQQGQVTTPSKDLSKPSTTSQTSSDKIWAYISRRFPAQAPESRLYFTCLTSTLLPIGIFIFGLTARPDIHWMAPCVGIALTTMGILSIYLAIFNYFADSYHQYASSALAAQSLCRNLVGGSFPLVTALMFEHLGEVHATAVLGCIAVSLSFVPWVLVFYGEKIRARSPFASQLGQG